ncbi:hypothetical protein BT63DRAFT_30495 [Microthyrium microscopicum]|uniref:EGF-like domain-containing protein n=1 Tax=Microthyrium microscopicum TaxID=703497 RepID=A0A6A6UTS7_9PEZI|nr:hypothetical protein BT63DRAFT_30495 [Microthyrium microscopicum]
MSYSPRGPGRPQTRDGYPRGDRDNAGSVRAARERLQQAQSRLQQTVVTPDLRESNPLASQYQNSTLRSPPTFNERQPRSQSPVGLPGSPQIYPQMPQPRMNSPMRAPDSPQMYPQMPQPRMNSPMRAPDSPQMYPHMPRMPPPQMPQPRMHSPVRAPYSPQMYRTQSPMESPMESPTIPQMPMRSPMRTQMQSPSLPQVQNPTRSQIRSPNAPQTMPDMRTQVPQYQRSPSAPQMQARFQPQEYGQFHQPSPSPQWPLQQRDGSPGPAALRPVGPSQSFPRNQPQNPYSYSNENAFAESARTLTQDQSNNRVQAMNAFVDRPFAHPRDQNQMQAQLESSHLTPPSAPSRPLTTSSQASHSSLGTIPDFPIPANNASPQQTLLPNTYSNQRGPQPYYSGISNVSPIKEEKDSRGSVKSYASSNVFPSGGTGFYFDETPSEDDSRTRSSDRQDTSTTLVRQASLGKRAGRAALTSIKRSRTPTPPDEKPNPLTRSTSELTDSPVIKAGPGAAEALMAARTPQRHKQPDDIPHAYEGMEAPYSTQIDDYLGELEKGSSEPTPALRQVPKSMLGDRVGTRKPPDLDVEKVKLEEARGSITSLPELIRRATRLAANLDRGKTASRLGMDWMIKEGEVLDTSQANRKLATPSPIDAPPLNEWPSERAANAYLPPGSDSFKSLPKRQPTQRRCCGMTRNSFIGFLLLLILLVVAAVVIPVALIVIPKQNTNSTTAASCTKTLTCSNGGSPTLLSDKTCGCVCMNGFQGPTCQGKTDAACSTIQAGTFDKATVGTMVLPLLKASNDFSIPIDSEAMVLEFARANLTCASENALITFPGLSKPSATRKARKRQAGAMTTNGIVVAGTPTPLAGLPPTSTVTIDPKSSTSSAPQPSATATGSNGPVVNTTAQAFAKVGILFVLQDSRVLNTAVKAQEKLNTYMDAVLRQGADMSTARNVTLGDGYFINMWDFTVTLQNGTIYGDGWNGTSTTLTPVNHRSSKL